jgi:hypothetical protein
MVPVFASGNVAIFQIDGTEGGALVDISAYVQSVKFSGERKAMKLPVIGGGGVKKLAGPTDASLEIKGHYDAATLGPIFTSYLTDTSPTTRSISYAVQGATGQTFTGEVFITKFEVDTDAESPGGFSASLELDGTLTVT